VVAHPRLAPFRGLMPYRSVCRRAPLWIKPTVRRAAWALTRRLFWNSYVLFADYRDFFFGFGSGLVDLIANNNDFGVGRPRLDDPACPRGAFAYDIEVSKGWGRECSRCDRTRDQ
jgi:hypothetical protein